MLQAVSGLIVSCPHRPPTVHSVCTLNTLLTKIPCNQCSMLAHKKSAENPVSELALVSCRQIPVLHLAICLPGTAEHLKELLKHSRHARLDVMSHLSETAAQKHSILRISGRAIGTPSPGPETQFTHKSMEGCYTVLRRSWCVLEYGRPALRERF